jgi:hypothetical protein
LLASEAEQLIATARTLPTSWCLVVEPPFGQLAITPSAERRIYHRCHVAAVAVGRIFRDDGRSLR